MLRVPPQSKHRYGACWSYCLDICRHLYQPWISAFSQKVRPPWCRLIRRKPMAHKHALSREPGAQNLFVYTLVVQFNKQLNLLAT